MIICFPLCLRRLENMYLNKKYIDVPRSSRKYYEIMDRSDVRLTTSPEKACPDKNYFIIIAGGQATRMKQGGFMLPKPLYPLPDGRTLLTRTIDEISNLTAHEIRLQVRSEEKQVFEQYIKDNNITNLKLICMSDLLGHGDGARYALQDINAKEGAVSFLWCDMLYQNNTLLNTLMLHHELGRTVTMPTVSLTNPYASLERDKNYSVTRFLFQSDGLEMPETGEDNIGIFVFDINKAKEIIDDLFKTTWNGGGQRKVDDLLKQAMLRNEIFAPRIGSITDYKNINSPLVLESI
ncbi:MAG TPA: hypothetical protein DCS13_07320 [Candidatus Margulisbacteria bacterium]|nr:hypothetical protein [Candidatus Margulisiibacteriota bacterium]